MQPHGRFNSFRRLSPSVIIRNPVLIQLSLLALMAGPLALCARADKYPEPNSYPLGPELEIKFGMAKRIVVDVPGDKHPQAYWYMTYTLTNNNDKPFHFLPSFEMLSDDGKLMRSDKVIPSQVFEAIKKREGNKLLEPSKKIEGQIQVGEDQARDSVAIWPEPQARMGTFSIFVGGLSDEHVTAKDKDGKPMMDKDPKTGEETPKILRKQLHLTFKVSGDEIRPGNDPVEFKSKKWVMR